MVLAIDYTARVKADAAAEEHAALLEVSYVTEQRRRGRVELQALTGDPNAAAAVAERER